METIIIYLTKYKSTEYCAKKLAESLEGRVTLKDIRNFGDTINLESFDNVIVGVPIYMGMVDKKIKKFLSESKRNLRVKNRGLYICGITNEEKVEQIVNKEFDPWYISGLKMYSYFGGILDYKKMSIFDKIITKVVAAISSKDKDNKTKINLKTEYNTIDLKKIEEFAEKFNLINKGD